MKRTIVRACSMCLRIAGIALFIAATSVLPAAAATVPPTTVSVGETPAPSTAPGLIVTSLVGSSGPDLDYIELYNQSDDPINLAGWSVQISDTDAGAPGCGTVTSSVVLPNQWVLSKHYLTLQRGGTASDGLTIAFTIDDANVFATCTKPQFTGLAIVDPTGTVEQSVAPFSNATPPANEWAAQTSPVIVAQHKQRGNSPSSTRAITGQFDSDYKFVTGAIALNSDPLYTPPVDSAGLQIIEILPNPQACAPSSTDLTCSDYVKLYNPTDQPIDLAAYRLRVGSKGQSESVTNTFTWNQALDPANDELLLQPQQYFMLTLRNDGAPLSITDSGNFVWLEDAYGTAIYDPIVQYPDASSTSKVGMAWAFDGATWRWTSAPQPNAPNYFPPEDMAPSSNISIDTASTMKPCADNQYRNPLTNRCNLIVTATALLTPCAEGQVRNPETNRCRSIVTASAQLAACQVGWERNPDTNRCRKLPEVAGISTTAAVKDVVAPSVDHTGWIVAVVVIVLTATYGVYEWQQELRTCYIRIRSKAVDIWAGLPFTKNTRPLP